jgi:death-on-curing protein
MTWEWVNPSVVLAIHDEQIAEHGGASGIRDSGLLDSALARPVNLAAYGEPDVSELAAAYAFGIVKNHPFVDGNKRVAFVVMRTFLLLNGSDLSAEPEACVVKMLAVAEGTIDQDQFAKWLRGQLVNA